MTSFCSALAALTTVPEPVWIPHPKGAKSWRSSLLLTRDLALTTLHSLTMDRDAKGEAYPPEYVPKMIGWYREGKFPFDRLCKFMKADEFEQALKEM